MNGSRETTQHDTAPAQGAEAPADEPGREEPARDARRVVMPEEIGPMLVEGPIEIVLADGSVHLSERPTVALCTCRRSRAFPFCDTSHRRRSRPSAGPAAGAVRKRDDQ